MHRCEAYRPARALRTEAAPEALSFTTMPDAFEASRGKSNGIG
ncbi:hypothetical protein [Halochromatium sp.]